MGKHWVYHVYKKEEEIVSTEEREKRFATGEWVDTPAKRVSEKDFLKKEIKKSEKKVKELKDDADNQDK